MTVTTDNSQTLVNALVEIERLNDRLLMAEAILAGNGALITGLKAEVARLEPLQYRQAPCHHQGSPMSLYTRFSTGAVFIFPALCLGIPEGEPVWLELAWLGFAVGVKR